MSLNKRMCLRSDSLRRQSFSDRVCDDLCEVILQFLPLKDKLKLECVSKQFQRTALVSQRSMDLDILRISAENVEKLLKKLPNLKKILWFKFENTYQFEKIKLNSNDFIELIMKYCNNLTEFELTSNLLNKNDFEEKFFDKFGHKLITLGTDRVMEHNLKIYFPLYKTPNIEELTIDSYFSQLTQLKFNRLKRLKIFYIRAEELSLLEVFIENNAKTLKHLDFSCPQLFGEGCTEKLLKILPKAINLVHFGIG